MDRVIGFYKGNLKPLVDQYVPEGSAMSSSVYLTGAAAIIVTAILWRNLRLTSRKATKKDHQRRKKPARASAKKEHDKPIPMTPERRIHNVRLRFLDEYEQGVLKLLENYNAGDKDQIYQRNYYNEMLLKLLIELDGIDLSNVPGEKKLTLKQQRKTVIKEIQTHLKLLDKLA
ncbi:hypothetical protein HG536_0C04320 [Torulaspora globosa]|uniref:BAG domain-containing protein n=1 Tax=Torulaspora globosa TaxID=48254 RepID=A0A7G3ZFH7_9SACH|nr:uncharacterized protein HG536_0C04320 [Torulaspora globosa]QLL32263.1 hypothetical protein HG536_0C04320 [Torulaspora globosa]